MPTENPAQTDPEPAATRVPNISCQVFIDGKLFGQTEDLDMAVELLRIAKQAKEEHRIAPLGMRKGKGELI